MAALLFLALVVPQTSFADRLHLPGSQEISCAHHATRTGLDLSWRQQHDTALLAQAQAACSADSALGVEPCNVCKLAVLALCQAGRSLTTAQSREALEDTQPQLTAQLPRNQLQTNDPESKCAKQPVGLIDPAWHVFQTCVTPRESFGEQTANRHKPDSEEKLARDGTQASETGGPKRMSTLWQRSQLLIQWLKRKLQVPTGGYGTPPQPQPPPPPLQTGPFPFAITDDLRYFSYCFPGAVCDLEVATAAAHVAVPAMLHTLLMLIAAVFAVIA